ncbi:MAG: histidinol-phosphate transaminase [Rhodobacteraceae bacterium]|nr:histidinol-phosphate transaminase [Paracoccaceae bacterium]
MTDQIIPQPGILDIALYQGGASSVAGVTKVTKLSSNENPFGPSPRAIAAAQATLGGLHRYPPIDHSPLCRAIADVNGLDADRIICGVGSDEIITFLCQAYAGPGDEVLYTEHGFSMYRISALAAGATPVVAPETDRTTDVDALLAACTDRTRLVFIANPNNPTGTMIDAAEVTRLAEGLPPQALLVLDGAYAEFVGDFDGGAALVDARENVVMTRTFSKLYGLGGLRIGWGYGPRAIIDVLQRVRGPFNLSLMQLQAAEAAVRDVDYARFCRDENTRLRAYLTDALRGLGLAVDTPHGNFVLPRFASQAQAEACDLHLQARGLIVRRVAGYGLPECLRITVGDEASCRAVVDGIAAFLQAVPA